MSTSDGINEGENQFQTGEPSRRFACDRCQGQKLRCERHPSTNGNNACRRCAKARVRCITSPPRRQGRPPRNQKPSSSVSTSSEAFDFDTTAFEVTSTSDCFEDTFGLRDISTLDALGFQGLVATNNVDGSCVDTQTNGSSTLRDREVYGDSQHECQLPDVSMGGYGTNASASFPGWGNSEEIDFGNIRSLDIERDQLRKLSTLTSQISQLRSEISAGGLVNSISHSPSHTFVQTGKSSAPCQTSRDTSTTAPQSPKNCIGSMLDRSQEFLDILKHYTNLYPRASTPSSRGHSSNSSPDSDDSYDSGPQSLYNNQRRRNQTSSNTYAIYDSTSRSSNSQRPLHHSNKFSGSLPSPSTSNTSDRYFSSLSALSSAPATGRSSSSAATSGTFPLHPLACPDLSTILSILACFTSLRRVYATVFAHIYVQLQRLPSQPLLSEQPPILPGLQLAGFQLDGHHGLQINILRQISTDMLRRMENAVRTLDGRCGGGDTGNSGPGRPGTQQQQQRLAPSLLELTMRYEALQDSQAGDRLGGEELSLKSTMRNIKRLLKELGAP